MNWSKLTVNGTAFQGNSSGYLGGALRTVATAALTDGKMTGIPRSSAGASATTAPSAYAWDPSANTATNDGAGLSNGHGTAQLTDATIAGNTATGNYGGVWNGATMALLRVTISGNKAGAGNYGGGLGNASSSPLLTLTTVTVSGNQDSLPASPRR
jgi:hypothetical protein